MKCSKAGHRGPKKAEEGGEGPKKKGQKTVKKPKRKRTPAGGQPTTTTIHDTQSSPAPESEEEDPPSKRAKLERMNAATTPSANVVEDNRVQPGTPTKNSTLIHIILQILANKQVQKWL